MLLTHKDTTLPDGETPWPWRTNSSEKRTKKLSNVASETHRKWCDDDDFSYFCLLLLKRCCSPTKAPPSRTGKHHGPEGRTRPRIAPKKSLTSLLKPIENDDWSYFCLLLLKRCCSPTTKSLTSLLKPIEHEDFSYFCLLLLKRCCSPTKTPPSRTGKHHGPEGRTSPRIAPKNSLTSLLKPTWSTLKRIIIQQNDFY